MTPAHSLLQPGSCPLMDCYAEVAQALGNPRRLMLLMLLSQAEMPVEELALESHQTIASASAHLKVLREANLVASHKEGKYVFYRLALPEVATFLGTLRDLAEHLLPEVRETVRVRHLEDVTVCRISPDEVLAKAGRGELLLLDLRSEREFRAAHLPHAISLPVRELADRLQELPEDKPLVAYCRGPYCVTALEGVTYLRSRGLDAFRLPLGVVEWLSTVRDRGVASAPTV